MEGGADWTGKWLQFSHIETIMQKKVTKKTHKIVLTSENRCDNMKNALLWCHMPKTYINGL